MFTALHRLSRWTHRLASLHSSGAVGNVSPQLVVQVDDVDRCASLQISLRQRCTLSSTSTMYSTPAILQRNNLFLSCVQLRYVSPDALDNQLRFSSSAFGTRGLDSFQGRRRKQRLNEFGHDYTQIGGPIDKAACGLSEVEIHNMIRDRMKCRISRDFQRADTIIEQLQRHGVFVDDREKTWRAKNQSPRMSSCRTINEATNVMFDNLEKATPNDLVAFWVVVPQFLRHHDPRTEQLGPQMNAIFNKTADRIGKFDARNLSTVSLAFGKIIKIVRENKTNMYKNCSHEEFLKKVIVGKKEVIFLFIANTSVPILSKFDPRSLANLVYACALAGSCPRFDAGSTLFEKVGDHIVQLKHLEDFTPQNLSNTVWAFAKAEVSHFSLFDKVEDHIIQLEDLEAFDAQALSNILWAFAKAGATYPRLFERVGEFILSLGSLDEYSGQSICNIVWALVKADVRNPQLYDNLVDVAIKRNDEFTVREIRNLLHWTK